MEGRYLGIVYVQWLCILRCSTRLQCLSQNTELLGGKLDAQQTTTDGGSLAEAINACRGREPRSESSTAVMLHWLSWQENGDVYSPRGDAQTPCLHRASYRLFRWTPRRPSSVRGGATCLHTTYINFQSASGFRDASHWPQFTGTLTGPFRCTKESCCGSALLDRTLAL